MADQLKERSLLADNKLILIVVIAAFVIALIANAPASLLGIFAPSQSNGLQYKSLEGTIWKGKATSLVYNGQYYGDVEYTVSPVGIILGTLKGKARIGGGAATGRGNFSYNAFSETLNLRDVTAEYDLTALEDYSIFGLPYNGVVQSRIDRFEWNKAGCKSARATIWTDILNEQAQIYIGEDMPLSGDVACVDQEILVSLTGANKQGTAFVQLSLNNEFRFSLSARVDSERVDVRDGLQLLGFERDGEQLKYDAVGELKGAGT